MHDYSIINTRSRMNEFFGLHQRIQTLIIQQTKIEACAAAVSVDMLLLFFLIFGPTRKDDRHTFAVCDAKQRMTFCAKREKKTSLTTSLRHGVPFI
jgi:hypothetical protein